LSPQNFFVLALGHHGVSLLIPSPSVEETKFEMKISVHDEDCWRAIIG
jgi:hypothetical protein